MAIACGIIVGGLIGGVVGAILTAVSVGVLGFGPGLVVLMQVVCIGIGAWLGYRMATRPSSY